MKSKIFCFNWTIFKKNTARFWPIWAFYLVILIFSMPISIFLRTRYLTNSVSELSTSAERLDNMLSCLNMNLVPAFVFVFAIVSAIAVFSYLYSARNCNMIHALPVKRGELFFTNYVCGLLFLIVPQIITFLLSMFVCIINSITSVEYLFFWLTYMVGMSFFFYSCAVFCCMLTGQYFAGFVYYVIGNTIYAILKYLIATIVSTLCYGMTELAASSALTTSRDVFFSPIVYLCTKVSIAWEYNADCSDITQIHMTGGNIIACYLVPAIILIVLAMLLYKKRHLECAGDILSIHWLKPLFRWLVAFCAGIGLAMIFTLLFFVDTRYCGVVLAICTVIFSWACFFLAEMLLRKKFRVFRKKRWIEWGVCACVFLFILGAVNMDLFHVERHIPETDEIQAARLNSDYDIIFTDAEDLAVLADIHKTILDNKKDYENYYYDLMQNSAGSPAYYTEAIESENGTIEEITDVQPASYGNVTIEYYLKNGRTVTRCYYVPTSEDYLKDSESAAGKIRDLQKDPETYLKYLLCENYEDIQFQSGTFWYLDENDTDTYRDLTKDEITVLFEAVKQDIAAGNYPYGIGNNTSVSSNLYYNSLSFDGRINGSQKLIYDVLPAAKATQLNGSLPSSSSTVQIGNDRGYTNIHSSFAIADSCEYTIQALIDLEIIRDESELIYQDDYDEILTEYYEP